ncbi:hypothetical protein SGRIM128S_02382 [Streptomyces griseomycini]
MLAGPGAALPGRLHAVDSGPGHRRGPTGALEASAGRRGCRWRGAGLVSGQRVASNSSVSITRFEKPHSLPYHATTSTWRPSTRVRAESEIDGAGVLHVALHRPSRPSPRPRPIRDHARARGKPLPFCAFRAGRPSPRSPGTARVRPPNRRAGAPRTARRGSKRRRPTTAGADRQKDAPGERRSRHLILTASSVRRCSIPESAGRVRRPPFRHRRRRRPRRPCPDPPGQGPAGPRHGPGGGPSPRAGLR